MQNLLVALITLLFVPSLSGSALASTQPVKSKALQAVEKAMANSPELAKLAETPPVLLDMDGKIYPHDEFPESCRLLLKDSGCAVDSYGHYHVESKKEGDLVYSKATFADPDGPQVIEESWEKDGHVQSARIENKALKKLSELEVKNGKVIYKTTDPDGKVKTETEEAEENLVVPSTVMSYIRPFHKELDNGKEIKIRVAVLDRREAFTFVIKKDHEDKSVNGDEIMVLKMAPTSILVKALVDPLYFYVRTKSGELFAFEGRSALRKKVGTDYKEMQVKVAYNYKVNAWNEFLKNSKPSSPTSCDPMTEINGGLPAKCDIKAQ